MDRREALKKMMAGGAVVAGASMVSSSRVFAAGSGGAGQPMGPGLTAPPIPVPQVNDKRSAVWQIVNPGVMCSGQLRVDSYAVGAPLSGELNVVVNPGGTTYALNSGSVTVAVTRTGPGNSPFRRGDAFEFIWYVRYVCLDASLQPAGYQCREYHYLYVNQANANSDWQLAAMPTVSESGTCPAP